MTESLPGSRSCAIGAWVGVGNRDEPAALAGVSHFLEHLVLKGSSTVSARQIAEGIDARGGDLNAFTAKEYTAFHARLPASEMAFGLGTILDVITEPGFDGSDVEAERHVIAEELACALDTPDDIVHASLGEALFPRHALGREVLGTPETLSAMTEHDIRAFHAQWYTRANLVISVVGPVDHDEIVDRVDAAVSSTPHGGRPDRSGPAKDLSPIAIASRPIEQTHIALGWRGLAIDDDRRPALAVANQLLGGGWSSRLFQRIREERGLAYTVYSAVSSYTDAGVVSIYSATAPEHVNDVLGIVDAELDDLITAGPTERELDVARSGFEGATVIGLEDAASRMSRYATSLTLRDRVVDVDEFLTRIRDVDADRVIEALTDVTAPGRALSIVGPSDAAAASSVSGL